MSDITPNDLGADMRGTFDMLSRAASAILNATSLAREVDALRQQVADLESERNALTSKLDNLRGSFEGLDAAYRDLMAKADSQAETLAAHTRTISEQSKHIDNQRDELRHLSERREFWHNTARDLEIKWRDTTKALDDANAKLAKFRDILGIPQPSGVGDSVGVDGGGGVADAEVKGQSEPNPTTGDNGSTGRGNDPMPEPPTQATPEYKQDQSEPYRYREHNYSE